MRCLNLLKICYLCVVKIDLIEHTFPDKENKLLISSLTKVLHILCKTWNDSYL